ncbi:MAG: N-acetyl-gamma-glutamyl-phosphate reductase [Rhodospirillaceae bacterium]|nr:N-acetyl-gamma-glutamyl-phosphate reductase [Rhodospirillaceae bacterium]
MAEAKARIFIDGDAGTTGLQIRARLEPRADIELLRIDPARRKDAEARAEMLNAADVVILCLPDDAAREAVALITTPQVRVIDASTAHRTSGSWVYGLPELSPVQRAAVASALRVSNPGCYPTGAVLLLRPLVDAGMLPAAHPITINAVSGYTGGGRKMIEEFEGVDGTAPAGHPFRLYGLGLAHKHVPEIHLHGGLAHPPLFVPSVGRFAQGMLVSVPLALRALPSKPGIADLRAALTERYRGERFVEVADAAETAALASLAPEGLNGTNRVRLHVFGNEDDGHAVLVALLDNLGKGASGAAVQSLNLMLGRDEALGLEEGTAAAAAA